MAPTFAGHILISRRRRRPRAAVGSMETRVLTLLGARATKRADCAACDGPSGAVPLRPACCFRLAELAAAAAAAESGEPLAGDCKLPYLSLPVI
mgnify:CR=1 FL=1